MKEIRLHGRGGQGVVLAGEILVNAAVLEGKYANSIPYFGFERRGAPVSSFVRIDDKEIREKTQIYFPDCLIVLDPTLQKAVDIYNGLKRGGMLVINERKQVEDIKVPKNVKRIGAIDATSLSLKILKRPIPNTVMLGAFAATTEWLRIDSIAKSIEKLLEKKLVTSNVRAARTAFKKTVVRGLF
jgi:2-oxoacid:acceptor oxidoreductase gamma subunit (pyruvate/2-ketoisovalerate family)